MIFLRQVVFLWALVVMMAACNGQNAQQRARWDQQNILDYRYTVKVSCFCPPPAGQAIVVEVKNGLTTSVKNAQTGEAVDLKFLERFSTVAKLFEVIAEAEARNAAKLEVEYNPQFGFPTQAMIDYIAQAADDELGFWVEGFEVWP